MSLVMLIIMKSFWSFIGTAILITLIAEGIARIVESFKGNK